MTAQPKPANQPSEYLTIAEAAARYHVSRDYIRHRIIDGSLPAVRSGRRIIRVNSDGSRASVPSRPVDALAGSCRRSRVALLGSARSRRKPCPIRSASCWWATCT